MNAYGCSPYKGSEAGLGWLWAIRLAEYVDLWVITETESKADILKEIENVPCKDHLHFSFVDIGEKARQMCWNQGDWRFYYFYDKYQENVYEVAKRLHQKVHFDIVHHLNMICYREPGYLWKLEGCKYVWGPIGGLTNVPTKFLSELDLKQCIFYLVKNTLNNIFFKCSSKVKSSFDRADVLVSSQQCCYNIIKDVYKKESIIINETGVEFEGMTAKKNFDAETLELVWVGRMIPTKMLNIAIKTLAECKDLNIAIHFLGDGECKNGAALLADKLGVSDKCIWHGMIKKDEVQKILDESHLFFFTSIVEGTSHAVMEAIAHGLPVLCFDACAHGRIINDKMGFKIPMTTPADAVRDFATILKEVYADRSLLIKASSCESADLKYLSWNSKIKNIVEIYNGLMKQ